MSAYVYVFVYAESIFFNKRYYVETLMKIIRFLILLNPKQTWRTIYLFAVQVSLVQTVCVGGICAPSHLPAPEPNERGSTSWCDLFSLLHFLFFYFLQLPLHLSPRSIQPVTARIEKEDHNPQKLSSLIIN